MAKSRLQRGKRRTSDLVEVLSGIGVLQAGALGKPRNGKAALPDRHAVASPDPDLCVPLPRTGRGRGTRGREPPLGPRHPAGHPQPVVGHARPHAGVQRLAGAVSIAAMHGLRRNPALVGVGKVAVGRLIIDGGDHGGDVGQGTADEKAPAACTERAALHGQARFGARGGSLLVSSALTDVTSVVAAVDYQATDGDFPYTDESRFPPETVRRRNADRTRRSLYVSTRSRVAEHQLRVSGWVTQAERGHPPTSSTAPARARQWDTQVRIWGRDRVPVGEGRLAVSGLAQRTRLRYADPTQDLDQTGRTALASLETTLRHPVSGRWTMIGGGSGSYARARHPSLAASAHQHHASAFVEGTGRYGRLALYPALRTDAYWMPAGTTRWAMSPRLGLNWQPFAQWPGLHVKAQIGRSFRVPTFNDRYWQPGGNPDLRPERSWGGDLGIRLDWPHGHAELSAFGHRRRDQITWQPTGNGYWTPKNVQRVRALGGEASVEGAWSLPFGADLRGGVTYTITDARNRTDPGSDSYNEPLRYVPRDQLKAHSTLSWGPAALDLNARYTGRRYVTSDGSQFLEAYVIADTQLRLEHEFGGVRTELSLRLDNALDTDYESVGGRPMPPRHARLRLRLIL